MPGNGRKIKPGPIAASHGTRGRPPDLLKHAAILAAARRLIFSASVADLNVQAVSRLARVSKVTFYRHFKDLSGLVRAIITMEREKMTSVLEDLPDEYGAIRHVLIEFGVVLMQFLFSIDHIMLQRALASDANYRKSFGSIIFQEGPDDTCGRLAKVFEIAIRRGELRRHDAKRSAEHLLGMWQGTRLLGVLIEGCERPSERMIRKDVLLAVDVIIRAHANDV